MNPFPHGVVLWWYESGEPIPRRFNAGLQVFEAGRPVWGMRLRLKQFFPVFWRLVDRSHHLIDSLKAILASEALSVANKTTAIEGRFKRTSEVSVVCGSEEAVIWVLQESLTGTHLITWQGRHWPPDLAAVLEEVKGNEIVGAIHPMPGLWNGTRLAA